MTDLERPLKGEAEVRALRDRMQDRAAVGLGAVNVKQRIVEVIAMPYDEVARVPFRGEFWDESFARGAFDGIQNASRTVMANREHTVGHTVGKVLRWWPERTEGLVADVKIAETQLGEETLALAKDGMVSASIRFGAWPKDILMNRSKKTLRVMKAIVDHLSFVEEPAYASAQVIDVRSPGETLARDLPPLDPAPAAEELAAFLADLRERHATILNR